MGITPYPLPLTLYPLPLKKLKYCRGDVHKTVDAGSQFMRTPAPYHQGYGITGVGTGVAVLQVPVIAGDQQRILLFIEQGNQFPH